MTRRKRGGILTSGDGSLAILNKLASQGNWNLSAGIASGAHAILIPEIPYSVDSLCEKLLERRARDHNFSLGELQSV